LVFCGLTALITGAKSTDTSRIYGLRPNSLSFKKRTDFASRALAC
jgi:hypothetical protein